MRHKPVSVLLAAVAGFVLVLAIAAAEPQTNQVSTQFLLKDHLGNITPVSTNEVHPSLHPPASTGLGQQIPVPSKGTTQSEHVRERLIESKTGREWFPTTPPLIMPYLANLWQHRHPAWACLPHRTAQPGCSSRQIRAFRRRTALQFLSELHYGQHD